MARRPAANGWPARLPRAASSRRADARGSSVSAASSRGQRRRAGARTGARQRVQCGARARLPAGPGGGRGGFRARRGRPASARRCCCATRGDGELEMRLRLPQLEADARSGRALPDHRGSEPLRLRRRARAHAARNDPARARDPGRGRQVGGPGGLDAGLRRASKRPAARPALRACRFTARHERVRASDIGWPTTRRTASCAVWSAQRPWLARFSEFASELRRFFHVGQEEKLRLGRAAVATTLGHFSERPVDAHVRKPFLARDAIDRLELRSTPSAWIRTASRRAPSYALTGLERLPLLLLGRDAGHRARPATGRRCWSATTRAESRSTPRWSRRCLLEMDPPVSRRAWRRSSSREPPFLSESGDAARGQFPGLARARRATARRRTAAAGLPRRGTRDGQALSGALLARRLRQRFVRLALKTEAPIVPFAVLGGGEAFPTVVNAYRLGRCPGPARTFRSCAYGLPIALPAKMEIEFGRPCAS